MSTGPTTLLLGSTGLLGSALVDALGAANVIALTHRRTGVDGVETWRGDVTKPHLGLGARQARELAARVDTVVNCAAKTGFATSSEQIWATNVSGVERVLEFTAGAGARLFHLSTAFVEADLSSLCGAGFSAVDPTGYVESKRASEALVARSGLACHVVRPSVITGDSVTGVAASVQGFHFVLKSVLRNQVPLVPFEPGARLDFLPNDFVAEVVARMIEVPPPQRETWITGGSEAWTITEFFEAGAEVRHTWGDQTPVPRLVAPDAVERLIRPVFLPELPVKVRRRFEALLNLGPLVVVPRPLESSLPALRSHYGQTWEVDLHQVFRSSAAFVDGRATTQQAVA
jgi:nucleoside-diphosphate-sugar epimerase